MQRREGFEESTRVSKCVVTQVRQRHIPHPELIELSQDSDGVPNLVSSVRLLDPERSPQNLTHPSTPRRLAILLFQIASLTSWEVRVSSNA